MREDTRGGERSVGQEPAMPASARGGSPAQSPRPVAQEGVMSRPLPFPAASLAASVAAVGIQPRPSGPAKRQVLVFDSETVAHKGYTARRQALRDHDRHWALYDPLFNVVWRPWPAASVEDLRAALVARYPLFAALAELGVAAGLDQHTDPLAQAALWVEEIARAIRHRLSQQENPRKALTRPVADVVPPSVQTVVATCLADVVVALQTQSALVPHPADGRTRSLAAALNLSPDEPGWTDYLPWMPVRRPTHDGTLARLADELHLPAESCGPYLLHLAQAVLDTENLSWETPLNPDAYRRVDAVLRFAVVTAQSLAQAQHPSAGSDRTAPTRKAR